MKENREQAVTANNPNWNNMTIQVQHTVTNVELKSLLAAMERSKEKCYEATEKAKMIDGRMHHKIWIL